MALFERKQPVEYLIVGLGNPGREYERTRHNVGFMALDYIAGRIGADIRDLKQMALTGRGVLEGRRVLLVKPQTYMNRSGESVGALLRYYKLTPDRLIVVYDDVSMALGKLRVRLKGSAGGHNGVKSIIETVGDEWARVKVGRGRQAAPGIRSGGLGAFAFHGGRAESDTGRLRTDLRRRRLPAVGRSGARDGVLQWINGRYARRVRAILKRLCG